ncbi:MAG: DUF547 domain-containing protein [Saprospiraceae bacterium]|nr:DUF547 domain-containing protein [Saprospiraceae bacterium]
MVTTTAFAGKYQDCATELVQTAQNGQSAKTIFEDLAKATLNDLKSELNSDDQKFAFWMNLYNGAVQHLLTENPNLFDDRSKFFSTPRLTIGGVLMSLDDIEHGMIRKSKVKLSLGLLGKWFVSNFEKSLRVNQINPRIHFALNCGAKSCPAVAIYDASRVQEQLDVAAQQYLAETTTYLLDQNKVQVTALMSWFRGDFGGLAGAKAMLKSYNLIPEDANPSIEFKDYDWTLELGNYKTL